MSQLSEQLPASRERIRARLQRIHQSRRQGSLGITEIVGLSVAAVMVLTVIVGYIYFLVPARSRLASLLLERDRLQKQVRVSNDNFRQGTETKVKVQKITESLEHFETV